MAAMKEDAVEMAPEAVIGFSGHVPNGLQYTPDGKYVVYPLGSIVVLKDVRKNTQAFLEGHSNDVSCLAVSHDGTKLASGQINHAGVRAIRGSWNRSMWNATSRRANAGNHARGRTACASTSIVIGICVAK